MDKKNNQKISIWTNKTGTKYNSHTFKDNSILSDYERILNLSEDKNKERNLILVHPELNIIQISNKQEWDFLYKNNIINECIENIVINKEKNISRKILKINYSNNYSENNATKYSDIIAYIINNFSANTYISHFLNFLKSRNDILNEFKLYLIQDLLNYNIEKEKKEENYYKEENKSILEINNFIENIENKFNEIKNICDKKIDNDSLDEIKEDKKEEKKVEIKEEKKVDKKDLKISNYDSYDYDNENNKSVFNHYKSSPNLYKLDINKENLFGNQSKEEYYNGIEGFLDELKRSLHLQ